MIENPSEKDEIYLANVAKIGNSVDNIQYIKNVLSEQEHAMLLEYVKNYESWNEEPWGSRTIRSNQMPEHFLDMLEKVFKVVYENATSLYKVEIDHFNRGGLHLVKFVEGFSLMPHVDTMSDESLHIASVYYINDDYEGGEIRFPNHDLTIKPEPNSLIIFPGNENYLHQVIKITKNNRYSSAMWFKFTGSSFSKKSEWYGQK
jgi:hypothetical protein